MYEFVNFALYCCSSLLYDEILANERKTLLFTLSLQKEWYFDYVSPLFFQDHFREPFHIVIEESDV